MKKILFLCSQNKLRSPTAESIFCNKEDWDVRSAGLNAGANVCISIEDVEWADYIFVMEQTHKKKLQKKFREQIKNQSIICLSIPDNYDYMEEELIRILKAKVPQFVT
ncbi:low molecular weight protein tyrosine phosphatase family protein [Leucothrix arctica]|uniref:Phosphotyrosine protein phosphatase n=1 Tax=Leucothrix arctica TaxID=1481894 RepID=A0A317C770_9GAMM|nr:phosphotyrosine protein phosphatase [Leucothrix arctica]PWQ94485.1 phosphotyrosine protein phosphatase [Leucothrix arctica]